MNNPFPKYGEWIQAPIYGRTNGRYQAGGTSWKSSGRNSEEGEVQGSQGGNLLDKASEQAANSKVVSDVEAHT
ncbi:hypothetical protein ACOSQ2_028573 [Xanthoceras sorbifolium]